MRLETWHSDCDCSAEHLEPALDRFAQFFVAPLISEDGVEREVKAVDSECAPPLCLEHPIARASAQLFHTAGLAA